MLVNNPFWYVFTASQVTQKQDTQNLIFVLNSIISDVLSSNNKMPIDLNVMDFRQMFDAKELSICLNAFYDAGIRDDMLPLIHQANNINVISVKTPNGVT